MTPLFSPMYGWCLILALERVMETPSFVLWPNPWIHDFWKKQRGKVSMEIVSINLNDSDWVVISNCMNLFSFLRPGSHADSARHDQPKA